MSCAKSLEMEHQREILSTLMSFSNFFVSLSLSSFNFLSILTMNRIKDFFNNLFIQHNTGRKLLISQVKFEKTTFLKQLQKNRVLSNFLINPSILV